jgi:lysophospholipase L1-like esterase
MKLLVFGESTAFGACATKIEHKWCNVLATHLREFLAEELILENKGVPGDTLKGALDRLEADVIAERPDFFVSAYGLNDLRQGRTSDQILSDYTALFDRLWRAVAVLATVVVTVFPMREDAYAGWAPHDKGTPERRLEFNRNLKLFAADQRAIVADVEPPSEAMPRLVHPDGVHPNNLGHRFIGNVVANAMLTAPELQQLWVYDHEYVSVGNYGKQTTRYA